MTVRGGPQVGHSAFVEFFTLDFETEGIPE